MPWLRCSSHGRHYSVGPVLISGPQSQSEKEGRRVSAWDGTGSNGTPHMHLVKRGQCPDPHVPLRVDSKF